MKRKQVPFLQYIDRPKTSFRYSAASCTDWNIEVRRHQNEMQCMVPTAKVKETH